MKAPNTTNGSATFHHLMPLGASGSSRSACWRSVDVPFHPRTKLVNTPARRHGASSGQKKPTYGMFTPAAVIIAHKLIGGAAALRPAMMNTIAAVRSLEIPM